MSLSASDFAAFYNELHSHPPFAWQEDLAHTVCKSGWPKYLDMPTATGKTSVIDIAVFHLALEGRRVGRKAPLRIAYVVDRRLVVDGASEHAACVASKIESAEGPVTRRVAASLESFTGGRPLETAKLRGGMPRDNDWAKTPSQPTVITSTVDQVGSRLLFRGYGASDLMKPVHAGLLGTDTLFLLDEAHTSQPFLDTLEQIEALKADKKWGGGLPFARMFMSATLGYAGRDAYPPADKSDALLRGDDAIRRRLDAHKLAQLVEAPAGRGEDAIAAAALDLARPKRADSGGGPHSIGIVVNRVNAARRIYNHLRSRLDEHADGGGKAAAVHLLIGRARPLERDRLASEIDKIRPGSRSHDGHGADESGAEGDGAGRPVTFFVATQCIEVGVDVDFDALVTQIAPLDSLRQRFGRLDRIGSRGTTSAVIVATKEEASKRYDDPVYGNSIPRAWGYLKDIARKDAGRHVVDFGVSHFELRDEWHDATAPRTAPVTLMPSYVDMWTQTWPRPDPDPDPGLFLHGKDARPADVQVVWRADVTDELLKNGLDMDAAGLSVCGPSTLEAVSLPVWTARRWLGGLRDKGDVDDLEGTAGKDEEGGGRMGRLDKQPCAVRWRGARSDETRVVHADEIRPGDTLVVPAEHGGCDQYGWDEGRGKPVRDIGMEAALRHRNSLTIRLGAPYLSQVCFGNDDAASRVKSMAADFADRDGGDVLDALADIDGIPEVWKRAIGLARSGGKGVRRVHIQRSGAGGDRPRVAGIRIDVGRSEAGQLMDAMRQDVDGAQDRPRAEDAQGSPSTEDGEDGEGAMSPGGNSSPIDLAEHCKGVEKLVRQFGSAIGIDEKLQDDLALAARLHDVGKAEKRVQALWRGADPDDLGDHKALAKSIVDMPSRDAYLRCLQLARLPKKYRHECWSVRMAEGHPALKDAHDRDLVLYAIGTHHGYGRPLFPPVDDAHATGSVEWSLDGVAMRADAVHGLGSLDSGWVEMCGRLCEKYGPWRLAHIEAILRLADHRRSAEETGNE